MNCYFCNTVLIPQKNVRDFLCPFCPHGVHLLLAFQGEEVNITWLRLMLAEKEYQVIWYIKGGLHMLRIYLNDGSILLEIKTKMSTWNPSNVANKIKIYLPFV